MQNAAVRSRKPAVRYRAVRYRAASASRVMSFRRATYWIAALMVTSLLLVGTGCRKETAKVNLESVKSEDGAPEQDYFQVAFDYVKLRDKHNLDRSAREASYQLNRWIRDKEADPRWLIDRRMINTLPDAIRRAPATKQILSDGGLARLEFRVSDVLLLEEARWLRAISKLIEQTPTDPALAQFAEEAGLSRRASRDLQASQAAFDWTIRNIQLDTLLDYPKASAAGPVSADAVDPTADWPPPMRGVPGPGYKGYPWHVLMYGHGDAYQRARVFIQLLRQLRIDAFMLGIDTKIGRARPWLPAVLIDQELYLFDSALGLPIPSATGAGIATLAQTIEDPKILAALSIGESYKYPIVQEDLSKVVALIDASPEYLSQRMALVQQQLSAADQMVLAVSVSDLAKKVRPCTGITDVRLWAVPIETNIYQQSYMAILAQSPEAARKEFLEHGVFEQLNPVVKGRRAFLLGKFNKELDEEGAANFFSQARLPDATLAKLQSSRQLQVAMGFERPQGLPDEEWQFRLENAQRYFEVSKQHASYWMGMTHLQQANFEVAKNWLKRRTLEMTPDGPWTFGAQYNLARCYEALGDTEEAIRLYRIDESPQRHGNLLRALRLETTPAEDTPSESATENAS